MEMNPYPLRRSEDGTSAEAQPLGIYASWGARLGAWFIDVVALGVATWVVVGFLGPHYEEFPAWALGGHFIFFRFLLQLLLGGLYFTLCHSLKGQTLGKAAVGLEVFDSQTLGRLSIRRAFL